MDSTSQQKPLLTGSKDYWQWRIEQATTEAEQLEIEREILASQTRTQRQDHDRRRSTAREAAALLGWTEQRLYQCVRAKWFRDEFRTAKGWDVAGIAGAQAVFHAPRPEMDDFQRVKLERMEHDNAIKEIERRRMEREENAQIGDLLPASTYHQFLSEWLGINRDRLQSLPYDLSREATPEQMPLVYDAEHDNPDEMFDGAPLQKRIAALIGELERYLDDVDA